MSNLKKIAVRALMAATVLVLAACNAQPQATPTQAVDIAGTVQAELTRIARMNPSPTPQPTVAIPTAVIATATPMVATVPVNLTPIATLAFPATATPGQAAQPVTGDKAQWVANTPEDGASVEAGSKFDIMWTVKNVGTTTWTVKYQYRYYTGDKMYEASSYFLKKEVKPNETIDLYVDAVAPSKSGEYTMLWVLTNENGVNFGQMDIRLKVIPVGATITPTPTEE